MLKLPGSVLLSDAARLWTQLEASLQAEAAQVRSAAGSRLRLQAGGLSEFDSSALTLLLQAARLCHREGLTLEVHEPSAKLRELARVYGVAELLWPEAVQAQAA